MSEAESNESVPADEIGDVLTAVLHHATAHADRIALRDPDTSISYGELATRARAVARGLGARGVRDGDRVALLIGNRSEFAVAALGTLLADAAFVPLAPSDPPARRAAIVTDCRPALVLTVRAPDGSDEHEPSGDLPVLDLAECAAVGAQPNNEGVARPGHPGQGDPGRPAYLIYTSGTTGSPKGVVIGRGAFAAAVRATISALGLGPATRTLCVSPFHFDGSFATLFPTLAAGGTVILRPRDALLFPPTFFRAVANESITYTGFAPTYLRLLLASPQIDSLASTTLEVIALGGEAPSAADIAEFWGAAPEVGIVNRYGPTESTIAVTHTVVTRSMLDEGTIPLGVPHHGVTFWLRGDDGGLIDEPGVVGELLIGGDQLMQGYWDAPDLTAGVLRTDLVDDVLVYRTGDLAYRNERGEYVYVDRADRVVKRHGVRISLVEVSETLRGLPDVEAATCLSRHEGTLLKLTAFVVAPTSTAEALRGAARALLPDTMLPDEWIFVDALPMTSAGKVDERALLAGAGFDVSLPASNTEVE